MRKCDAPDCPDDAHANTIYCEPHLREFAQRQIDQEQHSEFITFTVYGNFEEPTRKTNAITVRHARKGTGKWSTLRTAIGQLIRPWYSKNLRRAKDRFWQVEGEGAPYIGMSPLWDLRHRLRFVWDGKTLIQQIDEEQPLAKKGKLT